MSWQLITFLHLLAATAYSLQYRKFTKKHHAHAEAATALMYLLVISPAGILLALTLGDISLAFSPFTWLMIVLGGLFFAIGNIAAYKASSKIDAAQFSLLSNFRTIAAIGLTYIFLNEFLNFKQIIGTVILFVATLMIANIHFNKKTLKFTSYSLLAFLSAFFFAAGIVNEKYLLNNMSFATYLIVGWGFQTVIMGLIAAKDHKDVSKIIRKKALGGIIQLGILRFISGVAFVYALNETTNTSLFASIISYKGALVVIGSYFILRERSHVLIKIISTVLATIGLFLLI